MRHWVEHQAGDGDDQHVQGWQQQRGGQVPDRVHVPVEPARLARAASQLDSQGAAYEQNAEQPEVISPDGRDDQGRADRRDINRDDPRDQRREPAGKLPEEPCGNPECTDGGAARGSHSGSLRYLRGPALSPLVGAHGRVYR